MRVRRAAATQAFLPGSPAVDSSPGARRSCAQDVKPRSAHGIRPGSYRATGWGKKPWGNVARHKVSAERAVMFPGRRIRTPGAAGARYEEGTPRPRFARTQLPAECPGTEVEISGATAPKRSALGDGGLVECRPNALGELHRIVVRPEMHEEHSRLLVEHVTMDRGDLDVTRPQGADQRVDLVGRHHELAGDRRLALAGRLEIDGIRRSHRCRNIHSALGDRVAARHAELIDPAGGFALDPQDLVELRGRKIDEIDRKSTRLNSSHT